MTTRKPAAVVVSLSRAQARALLLLINQRGDEQVPAPLLRSLGYAAKTLQQALDG